MLQAIKKIGRSRGLPKPTYYVQALFGEFANWAFCEERAPQQKGQWRAGVFNQPASTPLDLEIGTGNGYFFAHRAVQHPERLLVGIEKKFKPMIQAIRRAVTSKCENARMVRYHAGFIEDLFAANELNDVFIHFPDPWPKKKQKKNRLIQKEFLEKLFLLQSPGGQIEFKTDSRDYFDWAVERFQESPYVVEGLTYDLHNSQFADENFKTHFEKIFLKQNLPIHLIRLRKPRHSH